MNISVRGALMSVWLLAVAVVVGPAVWAQEAPAMRPVAAAEQELIAQRAVLRDRLPGNAIAYARVPTLWNVLGAPKGTVMNAAIASAAYAAMLEEIRSGFGENVLPELPPELRHLAGLLMVQARSPLELVVLPSDNSQVPFPSALLTLALDFASVDAFRVAFDAIVAQVPDVVVTQAVDASGNGGLLVSSLPVTLRFDDAARRLYLLAGFSAGPEAVTSTLETLAPNGEHVMKDAESRLDASGHGLFAWVNPAATLQVMTALGANNEVAQARAMGADSMRAVALGIGTAKGSHRLKLLLDMPRDGFRTLVPTIDGPLGLNAAGEPRALLAMAIPTLSDFQLLEPLALSDAPPESAEDYAEFKRQVVDKLGFGIEDLLTVFGQEMLYFADEAGQFFALRIRDRAGLDELLAKLGAKVNLTLEQRTAAGTTIHHARIPSLLELAESLSDEPLEALEMEPFIERMAQLPSHAYWVIDGDYMILANTPQSLMDRQYIAQRTSLDTWLREQQHLDAQASSMLATFRMRGISKAVYEFNLQLLAGLGDYAGAPVDLFALPTVRELDLPQDTAYSVRLVSSSDELSFELVFEHNPLEFLFIGGGTGSLAALGTVGVLAGIAIPAYEDYQSRANVGAADASIALLRATIENIYAQEQRMPNVDEVVSIGAGNFSTDEYAIVVIPGDGVIQLTFFAGALAGSSIDYVPTIDAGVVSWQCQADIPSEHLPGFCRE